MIITGLQNSLQKHHKTLLACLLVVIIASFVFYMGPSARSGGGEISCMHRGMNLADERDSQAARNLASFSAALQGRTIHTGEFLYAARRAGVTLSQKQPVENMPEFNFLASTADSLIEANTLGIPEPDEKTLRQFITGHRLFKNAADVFDPARFKNFAEYARDRLGLDEANLQKALGNAWRIQKLDAVLSPETSPGLTALASRLSQKQRTQWKVETAVFGRNDFTADIRPDEKALADYFAANKERYRVPEKIKLSVACVKADADAAKSLPAPGDAELRAVAQSRPDLFPKADASEEFLKNNRDALLKTWREAKSGEHTGAALSEKLNETMPMGDHRPQDTQVAEMIKKAGLTPVAIPAYSVDTPPTGTGVPAALLAGASGLNEIKWYTAIPYGPEVFVFIYDGKVPSRIPELAEVRARVSADLAAEETDRRFETVAAEKAAGIAAAVKSGKSFAEAAASAGFKAAPAETFELRRHPDSLAAAITSLEAIPVGGVSTSLRSGKDRMVVHIIGRTPPAPETKDPLAAGFAENIARMTTLLTVRGCESDR